MEFCVLVVDFAFACDMRKRIWAWVFNMCGGAEKELGLREIEMFGEDTALDWGYSHARAVFGELFSLFEITRS